MRRERICGKISSMKKQYGSGTPILAMEKRQMIRP
jgi:hypothetical protein